MGPHVLFSDEFSIFAGRSSFDERGTDLMNFDRSFFQIR